MEGQSPDQYSLIRVVYSAEYIFVVVVMFRYIDALFRNCDGPQLRGRENLARFVIYIEYTKRGKCCVLAPIVHVFSIKDKPVKNGKSSRGSPTIVLGAA